MIKNNPDMFHAFLSISQLVNLKSSEERSLNIALDLAKKSKNKLAVAELEPLKSFDPEKESYLSYMDVHRTWLAKLGGFYYSGKKIHPNMLFVGALFSPEYRLADIVGLKRGLKFSVEQMWAEIMELDLLNDNVDFEIPIYFIYGKEDTISDPELIKEYFAKIQAPKKEIVVLEHSGHSPQLDQAERYESEVIRLFS